MTDLQVTHEFIEVIRADAGSLNVNREFVEVLRSGGTVSLWTDHAYVETLRNADNGVVNLWLGKAYVEVLRSATVNPIRYTKHFIEVLQSGPDQLRTDGFTVEVLRGGPDELRTQGITVEVLRGTDTDLIQYVSAFVEVLRSPVAVAGSGNFNRAVSVIT